MARYSPTTMSKPAVLRFNARLSGPGSGLDVPKAVEKKLGEMPKVEGTINGHPFRADLESKPSGGRRLKVNKAMRRGAGGGGDTVELAILGPEPDPKGPADLRSAFESAPEAKAVWKELTTMGRQDWVRWIESAKKPETRARRVTRTVEQLSEGKRRACCVNVYEYMLSHVEGDAKPKSRE
jgi:hypothetical protein